MFTGWKAFLGRPFSVGRPLEIDEKKSSLDFRSRQVAPPYHWGAVISLNSTYLEVIDRRYRLRGMVYTLFGGVGTALLMGMTATIAWVIFEGVLDRSMSPLFAAGSLLFAVVPGTALTLGAWHASLRYDLFRSTHYPIRFNRKERMVYAFRGPEDGGIIELPWEEAFFHIGRGASQRFIRDLRGHVVSDGIITDTFTVGHYFDDSQLDRVRSLWEFIRRYMEEGPEAVGPDPLDRHVSMSTNETLRNCYIHVAASMGASAYRIRYLLFPIYLVLTLTRWAVFKTCRKPVWPAHIEEKCRIEPGDPYRWKEPAFTGEFENDPAIHAHELKRMEPFFR